MRQKFHSQMNRPPPESRTPFAARLVFAAQRNLLSDGESLSFDGGKSGTEGGLDFISEVSRSRMNETLAEECEP